MSMIKVGVQLHPQHTSFEDYRRAWLAADALGVDMILDWDHFFPLSGDPHGPHFEGWTSLAASAPQTSHAQVGTLVTLRITARYADLWHGFGDTQTWAAKNEVLNNWCRQLGRDPAEIARIAPAVVLEERSCSRPPSTANSALSSVHSGCTCQQPCCPYGRGLPLMSSWRRSPNTPIGPLNR